MDHVEKYLAWKESYAPRAAFCYKVWLERFYAFHQKETEDLGYEDATNYLNACKVKYKVKTRQYIVSVLKDYFNWLRKTKIKDIPFELIKYPRGEADHHKPIRPEQFEKILKQIDKGTRMGKRDYAILTLFWDTGLRLGELRKLLIEDMDFTSQSAVIVSEKNGGKLRRIFWSDRTNKALIKVIKDRGRGYIFLNYLGCIIDPRTIQRIVKHYANKAEIELTPHCLRTSWATERYRSGIDMRAIQWGLGHANLKTTQIYIQPEDFEMEQKLKGALH